MPPECKVLLSVSEFGEPEPKQRICSQAAARAAGRRALTGLALPVTLPRSEGVASFRYLNSEPPSPETLQQAGTVLSRPADGDAATVQSSLSFIIPQMKQASSLATAVFAILALEFVEMRTYFRRSRSLALSA